MISLDDILERAAPALLSNDLNHTQTFTDDSELLHGNIDKPSRLP